MGRNRGFMKSKRIIFNRSMKKQGARNVKCVDRQNGRQSREAVNLKMAMDELGRMIK